MIRRTTPFASLLLSTVLLAAPAAPALAATELAPATHFKLRCAAAFAQVVAAQARGDASVAAYPPLGERGREYFLRATNGAMAASALTHEELAAILKAEAADLARKGVLDAAMPLCLKSLEASGL
jgi:hypothetical protein